MDEIKVPKVSIIIPAYNSSKTIKRCLDSVTCQTYEDIEILVVDDGSNDDTINIVEKANSHKVRIIKQKHGGVSMARNVGIKESSGSYLMFLDSDDALEKNAVEALVECVKNKNNTIVKFSYFDIDENGKNKIGLQDLGGRLFNSKKGEDFEVLTKYFFKKNETIPCFSFTLFLEKKYVLKNNLFFKNDLYMMEDAVYHIDLFESGAYLYCLDEPLYKHYMNNDSVTHSRKNILKVLRGAVESAAIILKKIKYDSGAATNYFKIIFEYMARYICFNRKVDDFFFSEQLKEIAKASYMKHENVLKTIYWNMAKSAILNENHSLLYVLSYIYRVRAKIGGMVW